MKKFSLRIALAILAIGIVAATAIPLFVNADAFRPTLERQLSQTLGRTVTMGRLSLSLFSGSVVANQIAISDDPAFSSAPFLKAKSLSIGVRILPLIFKKQLNITQLTIEEPSIQLIQNEKGLWNFASLGGSGGESKSSTNAALPDFVVGKLMLKDGSASASSLAVKSAPFVYSGIHFTVDRLSLTESFPFELKAKMPAGGALELKGQMGPAAMGDLLATPFQAELSITHFDLVGAGVTTPSDGISMTLDLKAKANSDGKEITSSGAITAEKLHLARTGAPAKRAVQIDYALSYTPASRRGAFNDLAIHAGGAAAHLKGGFALTSAGTQLDMRLSAPSMPIDPLQDLLPAFGVTLPSGSRLVGGTLSTNMTIQGPAKALTIQGPVDVENTKLAGFDIGSKMQGVNPFGGKGGGTQIQTLKAVVANTPAQTQLNNIVAILPQVGSATGHGTVSAREELNFDLSAKFDASTGIGALAGMAVKESLNTVNRHVGFLSYLGFGSSQKQSKASDGSIPVTITGSAANPIIRVKLKELLH